MPIFWVGATCVLGRRVRAFCCSSWYKREALALTGVALVTPEHPCEWLWAVNTLMFPLRKAKIIC